MGTSALGGYVMAQQAAFACTAAQVETANAVLGRIYVPNNAIIVDVLLTVTDMDSSTGLLLDVGDAAGPATPDDDRFIAAFSGQAAGSIAAAGEGNLLVDKTYKYVNDTTNYPQTEQAIELTVNTVATTGVAGTATLTVVYFAP